MTHLHVPAASGPAAHFEHNNTYYYFYDYNDYYDYYAYYYFTPLAFLCLVRPSPLQRVALRQAVALNVPSSLPVQPPSASLGICMARVAGRPRLRDDRPRVSLSLSLVVAHV